MTSPQRFWDSVTKRISVCSDDEHEANYAALQINMQSSNQSSTCKLRRESDVCVCERRLRTAALRVDQSFVKFSEFSDAWLTSDAVLITAQASLNTVCVTRTLSCACQRSHTYRRVHSLSLFILFTFILSSPLLYFPIRLLIPFY